MEKCVQFQSCFCSDCQISQVKEILTCFLFDCSTSTLLKHKIKSEIWKFSSYPAKRKKIWDAKSKKLTSWNPWNAFLHIHDRLKKANVCILKDFRCTHVLCVGIYNHNMKSAINQVIFIFKIAQFSSCLQLSKANNFPEERNGSHLKVHIAPMM